MLTIFDQRNSGTRRELLRVGLSSFAGLSLFDRLSSNGSAAVRDAMRNRSVIVLNLQGGPTQFEMFDPKMSAPQEIRSITGEVSTSIPGVTFGGTLPRLASLAHRMAIVRSYRHGISSHGPAAMHVMAGGNATGAMMGALFARCAGLTNERTGMPQNALVTSHAISKDYKDLYTSVDRVSQSGTLPTAYRPFDPSAGGEIIDNMRLNLDGSRLDDRRALLAQLDRLRRGVDRQSSLAASDTFRRQAFDVLTRGVASAFDLSREDARTIAKYDTSHMEPTAAVKNRNSYAAQFAPVALGKQMLLARRLCEAGCGFVTVTCGGWDMHGGGKEFTMKDGLNSLTPAVDKAVSAFLEDVAARHLDQKILLVITGEFGRTPFAQGGNGRDHSPFGFSLFLCGGGARGGAIYGATDDYGYRAIEDKCDLHDLHATMLHLMGMDHKRLTYRFSGRDMRLTDVHGNVLHDIVA